MNKNAIKNYAVWARTELKKQVAQKAYEYDVTKSNLPDYNTDTVNGRLLSSDEKKQLNELITEVKKNGYKHVIEEVAYTWFNRFIALRYMEVNNYLPQRIRVFTNDNNEFKPDLLTDAIHVELEGLDKQKVFDYIEENKQEELYKYLLLTLCNDMNQYLPDMFTSIKDYKTLLFPDNLLREDSVLAKLITDIDEDSWTDQVQIIGWLYQYYNSELKDIVMKKKNYTKDDIPAATQLFTPDWIVRYMTENSLGRLWLDGHPNFDHSDWKYYLEEAEQEPEVIEQLNKIKEEHAKLRPEEIKVIDPCMGSGHILVYAFDVLMDIYRDAGYSDRDAAKFILENNLYGLEIDERAYHLAYFALMMKARSYNRRILNKETKFNLVEIREPIASLKPELEQYLDKYIDLAHYLVNVFQDAKELGSIINLDCTLEQLDNLKNHLDELKEEAINKDLVTQLEVDELNDLLKPLIKQARMLVQKYDVVITNPPYMAPDTLQKPYCEKYYPTAKSDLYTIFVNVNNQLLHLYGYQGIINQQSWMYLVSFEEFRHNLLLNGAFISLLHLGSNAFEDISGQVVQNCAFVYLKTRKLVNYTSKIIKLTEIFDPQKKEEVYLSKNYDEYHITNKIILKSSQYIFDYSSQQIDESLTLGTIEEKDKVYRGPSFKNNSVLRYWYEIDINSIDILMNNSQREWALCSRNGSKYRWFSIVDEIVKKSDLQNASNFSTQNKYGLLWNDSRFGSPTIIAKEKKNNYSYESALNFIECSKEDCMMYLALFNLGIYENILKSRINGQHFSPIYIKKLIKFKSNRNIVENVKKILDIHSLMEMKDERSTSYSSFVKCKSNCLLEKEYNLDCSKIDIYLNDIEIIEQTIKEELKNYYAVPPMLNNKIFFSHLNKDEFCVRFISYAVGCMFGRYSLDVEGLSYAGGDWNSSKYSTFIPDTDDIIPICDEEYFEDDLVTRFVEFVRVVYGSDTLEDNLSFIANALGGKGASRDVLRNYFLNDFFKNHCKTYQKRPIYWLFDSGKNNGFKALVYIHRYTPDLIARMRTGYIHPQQARYRTQVELLQSQIDEASSTSEKVKLSKQLKKINEQLLELNKYEEVVHHWADKMEPMDLDDGVKANYAKFQELLAKIK